MEGTRKGNKSLGKSKIGHKQFAALNSNAANINGVIDRLRIQLGILEAGKRSENTPGRELTRSDIKADRKGKEDYERELFKIRQRRQEALDRIARNTAWAEKFDQDIGPFERKYAL